MTNKERIGIKGGKGLYAEEWVTESGDNPVAS